MEPKKTEFGELFAYSHYLELLNDEKLLSPDYWRISHDSWRLYSYGKGFKVVYFKTGGKAAKKRNYNKSATPTPNNEKDRLSQSVSRTKSAIFELAFCNEFSHFCTFTQDAAKVGNRFDLSKFRKDLAQFIRNQNRGREQKIEYLFVPEQHKDGAWHIHGLMKGLSDADLREFTLKERLPQRLRKMLASGEKVYNWDKISKKFGFFTATPVKSHASCSKYITKYITKEVVKGALERGAHSYFASQGLKRRNCIISTEQSGEYCPLSEWQYENDYIKSAWFDNAEELSAVWGQSPKNGTL